MRNRRHGRRAHAIEDVINRTLVKPDDVKMQRRSLVGNNCRGGLVEADATMDNVKMSNTTSTSTLACFR